MFCPYCGKQLNEEARFCVYCGHPLSVSNDPVQDRPAQPNSSVRGNQTMNAQPAHGNVQMNAQPQPVIPPASLLPEGEEDTPEENNTGLIVLIIILITLIILVGILAFAYLGGYIDF